MINFSPELSRLFIFVSNVATAIRMHSAYNQSGEISKFALIDLMWLSDSLHNLDSLGNAIQSQNSELINEVCDQHINSFEFYKTSKTGMGKVDDPSSTFERNKNILNLDEGIAIFKDIKLKVQPSIASDNASEVPV